jgi:putative nucleotidyltransferase with HDIG domain
MTSPAHPHRLVAAMTAWQAVVPFAPWLVDQAGTAWLGAPPRDLLPANGLQTGRMPDDQPWIGLWTEGDADGWCAGLTGVSPEQAAGAEALLRQAIESVRMVDQPLDLGHWSHHALRGLAQALGSGDGDLQSVLGTALHDARAALPARVMAVAVLDDDHGTLDVVAGVGAALSLVRDVMETLPPGWGRDLAKGEPVALPDSMLPWGPGFAIPLLSESGSQGWLLVWSEKASRGAWLGRAGWIASHLALMIGAVRRESDWQEALLGIFAAVAATVDGKSPHSAGQSGRATLLALAIADEMGTAGIARRDLRLAGLLHDIGNIVVPDAILTKKGTLNPAEIAEIRQHPLAAARMLGSIPRLAEVRRAILHHHERWDGTGYPERMVGNAIPVGARILAVADAFIALLSPRPYRDALSLDGALTEIRSQFGAQFDPEVGEALLRCLERDPGLIASLTVVSAAGEPGRSGSTGPLAGTGVEAMALRLPVMPDTVRRLHDLAALDPKPPAEVISLLSTDPALSARIMRYANSRKLGFARQITTVSQAVMLLGADKVCNLALGFGLYDSFLSGESQFTPWEYIGPHGLLTATGARLLCQAMGLEAMEDEAFMAGMLHDVGRALLAQEHPDLYARVNERQAAGEDLLVLERALLGTDHAAVGARAAQAWGLPHSLVQAIAQHHDADNVPAGSLPAIIAAASELARLGEQKLSITAELRGVLCTWLSLEAEILDTVVRAMTGEANPILVSLRPGSARPGRSQKG